MKLAGENDVPPPLQNVEFAYVLVGMVKVASRIRGEFIDQTSEASVALKNSIAEKGVLEPILITQNPGGDYRLIAGERRLLACRALNMETIDAMKLS